MAVHVHRDAVPCERLTHTLNMTLRNVQYPGAEGAQETFFQVTWKGRGGGGRVALEGKGTQRQPQKRLGRRLEAVAKAVGGGYCRLQMPLKPALGVRETVAGHRLGALAGGGGGTSSPSNASLPIPGASSSQLLCSIASLVGPSIGSVGRLSSFVWAGVRPPGLGNAWPAGEKERRDHARPRRSAPRADARSAHHPHTRRWPRPHLQVKRRLHFERVDVVGDLRGLGDDRQAGGNALHNVHLEIGGGTSHTRDTEVCVALQQSKGGGGGQNEKGRSRRAFLNGTKAGLSCAAPLVRHCTTAHSLVLEGGGGGHLRPKGLCPNNGPNFFPLLQKFIFSPDEFFGGRGRRGLRRGGVGGGGGVALLITFSRSNDTPAHSPALCPSHTLNNGPTHGALWHAAGRADTHPNSAPPAGCSLYV